MCPRAILGPEDTAGVKTDKALFSRVFLSTAEAGVGGCGGEQDLSDNKQKLWFQVVITQLRNHSNTDLEDHLRQVMSQDLSEEVTRAQIDKTAPATEAAERITSTQTLKQGRAWRIQRAGKAMNLKHQELERPVLRWGLRVSRRPFLGKDSSGQPLQGSFWCCSQHRVRLWNTGQCCLRYTYYRHHRISSFVYLNHPSGAHPLIFTHYEPHLVLDSPPCSRFHCVS